MWETLELLLARGACIETKRQIADTHRIHCCSSQEEHVLKLAEHVLRGGTEE